MPPRFVNTPSQLMPTSQSNPSACTAGATTGTISSCGATPKARHSAAIAPMPHTMLGEASRIGLPTSARAGVP